MIFNNLDSWVNCGRTSAETRVSRPRLYADRIDQFTAQLKEFKSHSELLKEIQKYRKEALGHVTRTLYQLEKALLDLEQLDEQVSTPALTRGPGVPIEVRKHYARVLHLSQICSTPGTYRGYAERDRTTTGRNKTCTQS